VRCPRYQRAQTGEQQIVDSLREKEVLLKEIHHRVKNNLQLISSLINMQMRRLQDVSSKEALEECQNRVLAIALIHEMLYQSKDYARVPFSDYARSLAANIFQAIGVSPENLKLNIDFESISLAVDKAIPCGLILNELITNALKHAFPNERRGTIRVGL
jgi:two-component system, sensor kinase